MNKSPWKLGKKTKTEKVQEEKKKMYRSQPEVPTNRDFLKNSKAGKQRKGNDQRNNLKEFPHL